MAAAAAQAAAQASAQTSARHELHCIACFRLYSSPSSLIIIISIIVKSKSIIHC